MLKTILDSSQSSLSNLIDGKTQAGLVAAVFQGNNFNTKNDKEVDKKKDFCALCEEFTANALTYLNANKTQTEIMDILYFSCSKLHFLKKEVI